MRIRLWALIALLVVSASGHALAAPENAAEVEAKISSRKPDALASAQAFHKQTGSSISSTLLVRALLQAGRYEEAVAESERLAATVPRDANVQLLLARALSARVQEVGLLKKMSLAPRIGSAIETAIAIDEELLEARLAAVQFYLTAPSALGGGLARANMQLPIIEKMDRVRGLLTRAEILQAEGKSDAAKAALVVAVRESDRADDQTRLAAGIALVDAKLFAEALAFFRRWSTQEPELAAPLYQIGRIAAMAGLDSPGGIDALNKFINHQLERSEFDPAISAAYWRRGQIKSRNGDPLGARSDYESALRINPQDSRVKASLEDL